MHSGPSTPSSWPHGAARSHLAQNLNLVGTDVFSMYLVSLEDGSGDAGH
jgi:hypothetical protein